MSRENKEMTGVAASSGGRSAGASPPSPSVSAVPAADANAGDWVAWHGWPEGAFPPVDPETLVETRWADGREVEAVPAEAFHWDTHHPYLPLGCGDIVAYRQAEGR